MFKKSISKKSQQDSASKEKNLLDYSYDEAMVLYKNDFEEDLNGWKSRGPEEGHFNYGKHEVKVELTAEEACSEKQCMKISGRIEHWNGAEIDITEYLHEGIADYEAMAWVKLREDAAPCLVNLSLQCHSRIGNIDFPEFKFWENINDVNPSILSNYRLPVGTPPFQSEEWQTNYPPGYVTENGWVLLRGKAKIDVKQLEYVYFFIETANGKTEDQILYIDDFVLLKGE